MYFQHLYIQKFTFGLQNKKLDLGQAWVTVFVPARANILTDRSFCLCTPSKSATTVSLESVQNCNAKAICKLHFLLLLNTWQCASRTWISQRVLYSRFSQ